MISKNHIFGEVWQQMCGVVRPVTGHPHIEAFEAVVEKVSLVHLAKAEPPTNQINNHTCAGAFRKRVFCFYFRVNRSPGDWQMLPEYHSISCSRSPASPTRCCLCSTLCLCSTVDSTNRPSCHKGLKTAHSATIPSVNLLGFGRICSLPSRSLFDLLSICQHAVLLLRRCEEGRHRLSVVIRCTSTFVSQAYLLPRNRLCHI
jgi:hypothetical protein